MKRDIFLLLNIKTNQLNDKLKIINVTKAKSAIDNGTKQNVSERY